MEVTLPIYLVAETVMFSFNGLIFYEKLCHLVLKQKSTNTIFEVA